MNRDEIMALDEDGLNKAILESMGWSLEPHHECTCGKLMWYDDKSGCHNPQHVADCARDWNAAGELFEEMCKYGIIRLSNGDGDSRDVDYFSTSSNSNIVNVSAQTVPLVIARAWLLWREEAK